MLATSDECNKNGSGLGGIRSQHRDLKFVIVSNVRVPCFPLPVQLSDVSGVAVFLRVEDYRSRLTICDHRDFRRRVGRASWFGS